MIKSVSASVVLALFSINVHAHDKVVVIPIEGDNPAPQFRIVPWGTGTTEANRGRLEYTADTNPTPRSTWGTVCDDCFAGDNDCDIDTPGTHAAANAVCNDLGYELGLLDNSFGNTGNLDFTLNDVRCPSGADSFRDCTSTSVDNCSASEQVGVNCMDAKLVFVTDTTYNGDLVSAANALSNGTSYTSVDGLEAGDALCQSRANAGGLPGTYKAWLSDSTNSPSTRFKRSSTPYIRVDSVLIAEDWDDLTDGVIAAHIDQDEQGEYKVALPWVNTRPDGTLGDADNSCENWTSSTAFGGSFSYNAGQLMYWSNFTIDGPCWNSLSLYCFQQ